MNKRELILPKDKLFTPSIRLTIMILLLTHKKINFTELQKLLALTPGNLDHHIKKLEKSGYVKTYKKLSPWRKPLTLIEITSTGKLSFESYLTNFRDILNKITLPSENDVQKQGKKG
ncbi:MAG: transcriptional regulator [Candidatus Heimdallarchaeota archaeon]|nr:transcriptional regulator [Candidatus Heimdallarchaeota archaeon]